MRTRQSAPVRKWLTTTSKWQSSGRAPPASARRGAYIHTACERKGQKWTGTSDIYMPCMVGEGKSEKIVNTCHLSLGIEINSISNDKVTGRGQSLKKFDCGACKVIEAGWANFEWVPAK